MPKIREEIENLWKKIAILLRVDSLTDSTLLRL
jgi:hypothetical protein